MNKALFAAFLIGIEIAAAQTPSDQARQIEAQKEAIIARQQKQIEALTTGLQKVSDQLEASKPAPQVVENNR